MSRILFVLLALTLAGCFATPPNKVAPPLSATLSAPTAPLSLVTATPSAEKIPEQVPTELPPVGRAPLTAPAVLARFPLLSLPGAGRSPAALVIAGGALYSANRASDNVAVVQEGHVRTFVPVGNAPVALAADPSSGRIYVSNYYTPSLNVIVADKTVKTVSVPSAIQSLALSKNRLFTGLGESGVVQARDAETLEEQASVQAKQAHSILRLVVDAPRNRLYAVSYGMISALDLDTLKELYSIPAESAMGAAAVNPVDGILWVGIYDQEQRRGAMVLYDLNGKELKRLMLDDDLSDAAFDEDGRLYVVSSFSNRMTVVEASSGRTLAQVNVGLQPDALVVDGASRKVYVANRDSDSISVVDMGSLGNIATIPLAPRVTALAASVDRSRVYAANASSDSVFVIVNTNVVGEIKVGHHPSDLALDPGTGRLFASNEADGTVSVADETSLAIQSAIPVTRSLTSVAVDPATRRLFANSSAFALDSLAREEEYLARGVSIGSAPAPVFVRTDPASGKLFAVASNGIPGSNSRLVPYMFSEQDPQGARPLAYSNGGSVTALMVDPDAARVYAGVTHPLAYRTALVAWDTNGNLQFELPVGSRISGLAANPQTNHVFLAHAGTYAASTSSLAIRDDTVQIVDNRTQGDVGWLDVPGAPGPMTRLENTVYVAGTDDGWITLIGDASMPPPPAPTLTNTPTVFPTLTPIRLVPTIKPPVAPTVAPTSTPLPTATINPPSPVPPTATAIPPPCAIMPADPFAAKWNLARDAIGCPTASPAPGSFAFQAFVNGYMYDDLRNTSSQTVYVLFSDGTYSIFADTWKDGQPEDSCPSISPAPGLIKPIRGFGKVWCEQTAVRMRLPGANAGEYLIDPYVQTYERGMMLASTPLDVIALMTNMTWK